MFVLFCSVVIEVGFQVESVLTLSMKVMFVSVPCPFKSRIHFLSLSLQIDLGSTTEVSRLFPNDS